MPRIFETTGKDINRLDATQLTALLLRLITLEAEKHGIPRSCVRGTINISASDQGEDAHIRWDNGLANTEWLPNRFTLFQCKATDTSPKICEAEIFESDGVTVKTRINDVLSAGGAYVLFCITQCTTRMEKARIDAFRKALRAAGKQYAATASIHIYHADRISLWVNQHVSAITAVRNEIGAYLPAELKTWVEWSRYPENSMPFVPDVVLQAHISALRSHLGGTRKLARIIGLSGVGKTRLALEAFRPPAKATVDVSQSALSSGCVYVSAEHANNLPSILAEWVRAGLKGTVVVDNCDHALHKELSREVQHLDSQLNLLSLDFSIEEHPNDHPYIQIDRVSDDIIRGIVKQAYPGLRDADRDRIVEFAQGFPQMAVLIAKAQLDQEQDIGRLKDQDLVDRLVWQRTSPDVEARKVIVACSLFEHLGYAGSVTEQRVFAAEHICCIDKDEFFRHAETFIRHRILDRRNRYVRVVPLPLAITLASEWWRGCSPERARELFLAEMPPGMLEALCNQLAKLHFVPQAREIVRVLVGETGPFGQAEVLLSEQGSRLFRSIVEVNPQDCVKSLERTFHLWTHAQFLTVGPARRNLVWTLEKLCFWRDSFTPAARLMLAFGAAENETWGNNATNQFLQLYHLHLSGTQAPPKDRLAVLEEALASDCAERQALAVRALGSALETHYFSRMGGVEKQGSRPPAEDWQPKVYGDIFSYQESVIARLTEIACTHPSMLTLVKHELGERIRGLIGSVRYDAIDKAISSIATVSGGFWPEALHSIRLALEYEGVAMPPTVRARVESWQRLLVPVALAERLRLVVSIPDYEHRKVSDGHYVDVSAERAGELAAELVKREQELLINLAVVMTGEQRQGYNFGHALASLLKNPEALVSKALETLRAIPQGKGNPSVLCGFLAGQSDRSLVTRVLEQTYHDIALCSYLVELTRLSHPQDTDLDRVIRAASEGKVTIAQIHAFSYNSVIDHLPLETVIRFSGQVADLSLEGVACAFEILFMFCLHSKPRWDACRLTFRRYLSTPGFLSEINRNTMLRGHSWQETVCNLLQPSVTDTDFAVSVTRDIIASCGEDNFSYDAKYYVSKVMSLLLSAYFDQTWPIIGAALINDTGRIIFNLGYILGGMGHKEMTGEVLAHAPLPSFLSWCEENKPKSIHTLARMLPVLQKRPDNTYTWHDFARAMLDSFGDDAEFLRRISGNLNTFTWLGSVIPYYECQIKLMEELVSHRHMQVREWASKSIQSLKKQIAEERKEEEEHEFGIF